ncbi:CvpA family protein [Clavibacter zhangzhiyongii]|uniref:CvpA family protein n=1 Tax=Clavibacter zhangzhiyongii TaxID=2768071 RepID=UPI0039E075FA
MSPAVDIVILVVAVLAAVAGWRRGAIVTVAGLAGIVLGVVLALAITPAFLALLDQFGVADGIQRTFAAAMLMLVTTSLVSGILAQIASVLTRLLRPRGAARGLDRGVGAVGRHRGLGRVRLVHRRLPRLQRRDPRGAARVVVARARDARPREPDLERHRAVGARRRPARRGLPARLRERRGGDRRHGRARRRRAGGRAAGPRPAS